VAYTILILRSTILITVGESSKILLMDCGKRLHGIAETSKKMKELLFFMMNLTQSIILKKSWKLCGGSSRFKEYVAVEMLPTLL
jgi:hypothetical protein